MPNTDATFSGMAFARRFDSGSASLIRYGVSKVVTADTATTVGYRKSLVTFKLTPSAAMMKENSPICDRPMPTRIEVRPSWPDRKVARPQLMTLPSTTATVITPIGSQY